MAAMTTKRRGAAPCTPPEGGAQTKKRPKRYFEVSSEKTDTLALPALLPCRARAPVARLTGG